MSEPISMPPDFRKRLAGLREALLGLSKALIESERVTYEQTIGKISSPNHFLQLLLTDPWFAWLQPLSQLIVAMDEALDARTPLTGAAADILVKEPATCWSLRKPARDFRTIISSPCNAIPTWSWPMLKSPKS